MNDKIRSTLIFTLFLAMLTAQFRSDVQTGEIPNNLNGELESNQSVSMFDTQRFNISHGFSMSMVSSGQNLYSLTGFTNNISYLALDNLIIDALLLLKPQRQYILAFELAVLHANQILTIRSCQTPVKKCHSHNL